MSEQMNVSFVLMVWGGCAGGINQCNIFGSSGATSTNTAGIRSRTQSPCRTLPRSRELGVMLSYTTLTSHSLHTVMPSCSLLTHFCRKDCHFLHPLVSVTGACPFRNTPPTLKRQSFTLWKKRTVNLMRKQKPWWKAAKWQLVKVTQYSCDVQRRVS